MSCLLPLPCPHLSFPGSSSLTSVFRGDIGGDPSSSSSVSWGRPDVVLTPSCTPHTRGAADPPVLNSNDNVTVNQLRMNTLFRNEPVPSSDHLPFARLDAREKMVVVRFFAVARVSVVLLREMTARHQRMSARDSSGRKKSADALRAEFLTHECTGSCLILMSEATAAGFNPMSLSLAEVRQCTMILDIRAKSKKRKATSALGNACRKNAEFLATA